MDFMADQLADGRSVRTLTVLDDFNRDGLGFFACEKVVRNLNWIVEWRGYPHSACCERIVTD
jgi:putative transposase